MARAAPRSRPHMRASPAPTRSSKGASPTARPAISPVSCTPSSRGDCTTQPSRHPAADLGFAIHIEMTAARHDFKVALAAAAPRKFLGRIEIRWLLVAAEIKHRAADPRRELEDVGAVGQVEEARGA